MIQRIQTLCNILAGLSAFLTLKFPTFGGYLDSTKPYQELNGMTGGVVILLSTIVVAVLAWIGIGMYRNRSVQTYICIAGLIAEALLCYLYMQKSGLYVEGMFSLSSALHFLVVIFLILALTGIRKDEKLVRESDRLR
jgi:hypothetical protein